VSSNAEYVASIESYWSSTVRAVRPWCIFKPHTAQQVSQAVKALSHTDATGNWNIAVKSAGHTAWASNNVHYGVTIDLGLINSTVYSKDSGVSLFMRFAILK
jgi:hypothetical protein